MKVTALFRSTQQIPTPSPKITPHWQLEKKKGSRFDENNEESYISVDQPVNKVNPSLYSELYMTPISPIATYKDVNPYTRSHCLMVASYMLEQILKKTHKSKHFRHIGFTHITYDTLRSLKSPSSNNEDLVLNNYKVNQPLSSIRIKSQCMIGSGAVSVVFNTESRPCEPALVAKVQTSEFHLSLRELYIALAYINRRVTNLKTNCNNISWLTPTLLIYATLTEANSNEGVVSFEIPNCNMFNLLEVRKEEEDTHSHWYSRGRRRSNNSICASLLFSPTSTSQCWTLLDLSNAIHHSYQALRHKMKNIANEEIYLYLAYQLLALISSFHSSGIIHADLKPDNFLVHLSDKVEPKMLISGFDYGRSIDVKGYYQNVGWFTSSCHAKGFQSCEMLLGLPWSYGIDFYGIACVMHVLISGKYLSTPFEPSASRKNLLEAYQNQTEIVIDALMLGIPERKFVHRDFWRSFYTALVTFDSHSIPGAPNQDKNSLYVCQYFCRKISRILTGCDTLSITNNLPFLERVDLLAAALQQYEK